MKRGTGSGCRAGEAERVSCLAVLAVPPKCAVRDGVELLDQATDMVAKGAVKSRCYAANWKNPIRLTDPVVDYSGGHTYGPKKCTQNRTYATSRNYHDDP